MAGGPARCNRCNAPVVFYRSPFTSKVRTFDPVPVDGRHALAGITAYPVQGRAAYRPADLAELIQVQRQCSDTEAAAEVRDMTWMRLHECTTTNHTDTPKGTRP